jgi:hypothetical protein
LLLLLLLRLPLACLLFAGYGGHYSAWRHVVAPVTSTCSTRPRLLLLLMLGAAAAAARWAWKCWHAAAAAAASSWRVAVQVAAHFEQLLLW